MILFWVLAGVLSAMAAGLVLFRTARAVAAGESVDPSAEVYRRQLSEIDDLANRGLIPESERKIAHAEAARRLLDAADVRSAPWTARPSDRRPALIAAIIAPAAALILYLFVGAPGYRDQAFEARLKTWQAADPTTLSPQQVAAVLKAILRERPDDVDGLRYLALAEGAADNPPGAVRALKRAVEAAPERADLWELLGEALIFQAEGEVGPDAEAAFREALTRDPSVVGARFHLARAKAKRGDVAGGVADWRALVASLPAGDARRGAVEAAIAEAEQRPAVVELPGPDAIRGMVEGLAERLKTAPDDPEGWVRLVRAYGVLGDTAKRDAALAAARQRYGAEPDMLRRLDEASRAEPMK